MSRSREWVCPQCQRTNLELLPDPVPAAEQQERTEEAGQREEPKPEERPRESTGEEGGLGEVAVARTEGAEVEGKAGKVVRPPVVLDGAICVVLVLLFALLCRRFF